MTSSAGRAARYADYKAGKVSEDDMCGEMVTMHSGLAESDRATGRQAIL